MGRAKETDTHRRTEGRMRGSKNNKEGQARMIHFRKCPELWSARPRRCFVAALPCVPPNPPRSHLCNSISVALIDLCRQSTKWLAKSHSFFPFFLLFPRPAKPCQWHAVLFITPSLILSLCLSSSLISLSPSSDHCSLELCYS